MAFPKLRRTRHSSSAGKPKRPSTGSTGLSSSSSSSRSDSDKTLSLAAASHDSSLVDAAQPAGSVRRAGRVWSRNSDRNRDDLVLVSVAHPATSPLGSCMKVATLEESLNACSDRRASVRATRILRGTVIGALSSGGDKSGAKKLRFGALHVREYDVIAVDHPGVSKGPAVGLDWSYVEGCHLSVREYEATRAPRRKLKEIKLSNSERRMKLLKSGATLAEVEEMMASISEARDRRKKTLDNIEYSWTDEKMESAIKKFKIVFHLRKRHSEAEEDLWDEAQNVRTLQHPVAA